MNSFQIALINVLITLFYILPGFIIRKMNKASSDHLPTLSAVLVYIGTPFLLLKAFMRLEFSWETLASRRDIISSNLEPRICLISPTLWALLDAIISFIRIIL